MAIQDDKTLLCKGDLKTYHESISPYLGGNLMLGTNVSDYYSEDEKIIGVWTDGKPVYQRTVSFLNTTTDFSTHVKICEVSSWNIDNLISLYGATNNHSSYNQIAVPIGYNTAEDDKRIFYVCKQDIPNIRENGIWTRGTAVGSLTIIVQYTKTTDAVNSAVTTPGCYDINFPNTWPVNKEIFFGNGLYGYRETGTITQGASQLNMKTLNPTNVTKMINCGGQWYHGSEYISLNGCNQDYQKSGLVLSGNQISLRTYSNQVRTNAPYDIWVTYTK